MAASPAAATSSKAAPIAPASASGVTEFPVQAKRIGDLAQGPDGTITYIGGIGTWDHKESTLGRVGPGGPLGETAAPTRWPVGISIDSLGHTWLTSSEERPAPSLARLSSIGTWSQVPGTTGVMHTAPAAGGGVWLLQDEPDPNSVWAADSHLKIGRVSPAGTVTSFPFAEHEAGLRSIVEGHEGNAWFTEYFAKKIGRITPTGELTEFPLPARPGAITVDPDGNLWFTESEENRIGRITPAGSITEFSLPLAVRPVTIAAGADGRIWFTESAAYLEDPNVELGNLGRITPSGRFTQVKLPDRGSEPAEVIAGSEGDIWYSAFGSPGCEGGGGSCIMWEPKSPAIVGRVAPTPLKTVVTGGQATIGRRGVKVLLACEGGDGWNHCRGKITIKAGGYKVATAKYSLEADQARELVVPFAPAGVFPLGKRKSIAAVVAVVATSGNGSSRKLPLEKATPTKG